MNNVETHNVKRNVSGEGKRSPNTELNFQHYTYISLLYALWLAAERPLFSCNDWAL